MGSHPRSRVCETVAEVPTNLHISVTSRASADPPLRERVEQKFFFRPERMALVLALLVRTCRPDGEYPADQVNSLYFDTSDLEEYRRSDAGDSAKDKIRIRWYGSEYDPHVHTDSNALAAAGGWRAALEYVSPVGLSPKDPPIPAVAVWLERKTRRRFASTKQRRSLEVPSPALRFARLGRGIVPPALLVSTMAGFGLFARGRLCPVIAISYWRYRFVEPCTGFRVSMDSHIRSSVVMPGIGRGERGLELPGAVVEVKGPVFGLPAALGPLADIGSSWTRYSKYASSLDAHAADLRSVSRAWPSGMMAGDLGVRSPVAKPAPAAESRSRPGPTTGSVVEIPDRH